MLTHTPISRLLNLESVAHGQWWGPGGEWGQSRKRVKHPKCLMKQKLSFGERNDNPVVTSKDSFQDHIHSQTCLGTGYTNKRQLYTPLLQTPTFSRMHAVSCSHMALPVEIRASQAENSYLSWNR